VHPADRPRLEVYTYEHEVGPVREDLTPYARVHLLPRHFGTAHE
jgi:hypothetical protein